MGKGSREISGGPTSLLNPEDEGSHHFSSDLGRVSGRRPGVASCVPPGLFLDARGIIRDRTLRPSELTIAVGKFNQRINRNIMSGCKALDCFFFLLVLFAKFLTMSTYFYNQAENQQVLLQPLKTLYFQALCWLRRPVEASGAKGGSWVPGSRPGGSRQELPSP